MGVRVGELITFAACWHAVTAIWLGVLGRVLACMRFPVWLGARCRTNVGVGWNHVSCTPFRGREEEVRSIYPTASALFLRLLC